MIGDENMSVDTKIVITMDQIRQLGDPKETAGYAALAQAGTAVILGSDEELVAEQMDALYGDDPRQKAAAIQHQIHR